jgi:hypothetical protein
MVDDFSIPAAWERPPPPEKLRDSKEGGLVKEAPQRKKREKKEDGDDTLDSQGKGTAEDSSKDSGPRSGKIVDVVI